ncbi:carboxylate-amine ligase [Dictyobacter formicarum]|uniref:Putative glutamate--cysteine ligase 2 n=1 Tax=Dictyobacter formicarum TaxID=2778368 RepID=A0ABQ3VKY6_9CHLR|nr:glutamate--cysteine ligase [Dictyobacter formicarum]GHO86331.1 putative glutamate--cysteine ligase 2 [Dictyobacter formicarum]
MPKDTTGFTMGIEEEYLIVDPQTREQDSAAARVLPRAQRVLGEQIQPELQLSQVESTSPVCHTLAEIRQSLIQQRRSLIEATAAINKKLAASATHPFSHWSGQRVHPKERYQSLLHEFQQLAREQGIQGCHVHVGPPGQALAAIFSRLRSWLTPLLALSANSPFWLGEDSGYASFRTEVWMRWPLSGPPPAFASLEEYRELVQSLVAVKGIEDATKIYWDLRLSERYPTIECRVADVCLTIDEAVMIAGLTRALVRACYEQSLLDAPFPIVHQDLLRASHWRAARYGLEGDLVDVNTREIIPAPELVERLMTFVRPALEADGDWDEVSGLVRQTLQQGNGACRQRAVYQRTGDMHALVDFIINETARGVL